MLPKFVHHREHIYTICTCIGNMRINMHIIQSIYSYYTAFIHGVYSLYAVEYPNIPHAKQAECSGFWQGWNDRGVNCPSTKYRYL